MRIAVTGGAGFIGSHLADLAVREGHAVLLLDDLSGGDLTNLRAEAADADFEHLDVRDSDALQRCFSAWRPDAVIHLAAIVSVPRSVAEPLASAAVNLTGTLNALEAARQAAARRFVFASSSAVYGENPRLPLSEDDPPAPISPYGAQKAAGELFARVYRESYGLETVPLRFFNVFGERQPADSAYSGVISLFANALAAGRAAQITGDGEQSRDFIYVADVARVLLAAVTEAYPGPEPINVGRGEALTVRRLYSLIAERCAAPDEPILVAERPGDIRHSLASIERLRQRLPIGPGTPVEVGLDRLIAQFARRDPAN